MTAPRLSPETQYRIFVRCANGEKHEDLALEYGVTKILIGRIAKRDPKKMLENADMTGEFKPRYRRPAVTRPLTVAAAEDQATLDAVRECAKGSQIMPKKQTPVFSSLAPPGVRTAPVGLVRKHGTHQHVTGQGSIIVMDSEGKAVRVLRCPVYDEKWRTIRIHDVEITSIDGTMVRGEARKLDGETVPGFLVIDGIKSPDSGQNIVTRVEFHPDSLPAKYVKEREALRRKLQ